MQLQHVQLVAKLGQQKQHFVPGKPVALVGGVGIWAQLYMIPVDAPAEDCTFTIIEPHTDVDFTKLGAFLGTLPGPLFVFGSCFK